jgi:hypothetical protein
MLPPDGSRTPEERSEALIDAASTFFKPGMFDTITLDVRIGLGAERKPRTFAMRGKIPFENLSEKGRDRARMLDLGPGDQVTIVIGDTGVSAGSDLVGRQGGKCDFCERIQFAGDGMLVSVESATDKAISGGKKVAMVARAEGHEGIEPSTSAGSAYAYLICRDERCIAGIQDRISGKAKQEGKPSQGGCFVATAAYGSPLAEEVQILRRFRDRILNLSIPGRLFVRCYYRMAPGASHIVGRHPAVKSATRRLLSPIVAVARVALLLGRTPGH